MKNLSFTSKIYIMSITLTGLCLVGWTVTKMDWMNLGLYLLAILGAVAQTLKLEGPNSRTNYSIAWFVYGFAFLALGPAAAIVVVVVSHLVEWMWHQYPWYIQIFNIGNHVISVFLAGLVFSAISRGTQILDLGRAAGIAAANSVFVFGNHFLVGLVVKLARGQTFEASGVFGVLTLFLDFTVLAMGSATALILEYSPFAALFNVLPLYRLYEALRVPALKRQLREMKRMRGQMQLDMSGD